jgi:RNA polymerase sigma-70 factor (ECF subfamily)
MNKPLRDPEVFNQLYTDTHLIVFRYVYGLHGGPDQDVEDLTSETYINAWKARDRYTGDINYATAWLLKIARNLTIDHHRRRKTRNENYLEEISTYYQVIDPKPDPEKVIEDKELFIILWQLIQNLNFNHREIITLRYILGWKVKDIAQYLDIPENTVSVNIRRILSRIRRDWPKTNP